MDCDKDDKRAGIDATAPIDVRRVRYTLPSMSRPTFLDQIEGAGAPRTFVLDQKETVVGRAPEAGIRIDSEQVSRRHMLIRKEPQGYCCVDLDSRNGTYINGMRIKTALLKDGDAIAVGSAVLKFHKSG